MSARQTQVHSLDRNLPTIDGDPVVFRQHFDRSSFAFRHRLADNPLFELPRLLEMAKRGAELKLHLDVGDVRVDQRWDQIPKRQATIEEIVPQIAHSGAWLHFKPRLGDPSYTEVIDEFLAEVDELTGGGLPETMIKREATVLITSPGRVTPYHIDKECNFLLQIRGCKTLYVFDRNDREVLPEEEIERFWAVDTNSAVYRKCYQDRAQACHLEPGVGVHIPVNAPHWVKNSDDVSVSLSLSFQYPDPVLSDVYTANYCLRKLGLKPRPPGTSKFGDTVKGSLMGVALRVRRAGKRLLCR